MRIGVLVCHCGSNIAGTVDCVKVAAAAKDFPDVVYSDDTMYACSEPGQQGIIEAIKEHNLTGVVVASCSPRMHEPTFRRAVERAGLNKFMFEMANIREHVSWIGKDKDLNTNKSIDLVMIAAEKLRRYNQAPRPRTDWQISPGKPRPGAFSPPQRHPHFGFHSGREY